MPKCFIRSEYELQSGKKNYKVLFEADDGHVEAQEYQCSEDELKEALTHFNDTHLASLVPATKVLSLEEQKIITVKSSKQAIKNLKKLRPEAVVE